jgi:predicted DNA-binding transcriptional regulator AlpA
MSSVARSQSVGKDDPSSHPPKNGFLKRQTVAERLGVSIWTLARMWNRGEGPPRRRLTPRFDGCTEADLSAYLENLT